MKPTLTLTALLLAPLGALHAAETPPISTPATSAADFSYSPRNLGTGKLPPSLPPSTRYVTVNRGSDDPEVGAFSTLPNIEHFKGRFFVTWQNHVKDEDQPGQRLQMRHSTDGGKTWLPNLGQPPVMLSSPLGVMLAKGEKSNALKRTQWNSGFAFTHDGKRLWAIANLGENMDKGLGLLALELQADGTRGEALWLEPEPVVVDAGFPIYPAMNDPRVASLGKTIRDVIDHLSAQHAISYDTKRRAGNDANPATIRLPNLPGSPADGQRLIEPSPAYRLKDGTLVRFWRDYGNLKRDLYIWRLYVSLSRDNGTTWSAPERTAIPSNSTRQSTGTLPDGRVFLIHNPYTHGDDFWKGEDAALLATASPAEKLGGARKVLTLSLSDDGIHFNQSWSIRVLETLPRIEGHSKRHFDVANPAATVVGDDLCIVYSLNKEDVELCKIHLPDLVR
jgi:hypothetical protein